MSDSRERRYQPLSEHERLGGCLFREPTCERLTRASL